MQDKSGRLERPVGARARRWLALAPAVLVALVVVGLSAWGLGIGLDGLAALGYPGVFLVMLISGAGTFAPVPGQAAVLAAGALWNPIPVGLAAGLGNASGELIAYAAARAGVAALKPDWHSGRFRVLRAWLERYGFLTILAIALVPNPLFDVVGILAGSLGYPAPRFWLACALGNSIKYVGMAYLGGAARLWIG